MKGTLLERFLAKISPEPNTGCWLWTGAIISRKNTTSRCGYGKLHDKRLKYAHRVAYELFVGLIPPISVAEIDHKCRERSCVNPKHLEVVTHKENNLRGNSSPSINARKTHCINGHEFNVENTIVGEKDGHKSRKCKTCHKFRRSKAYRNN